MKKVSEIYNYLNTRIPQCLSEDWDNDGLMCMPSDKEVKRILISLDVTQKAVDYAVENDFNLIISHHPLIFKKLDSIVNPKHVNLIKNDISVMSFHTRLDTLDSGVNDILCKKLGLTNIENMGIVKVGELEREKDLEEFISEIKGVLNSDRISYINVNNKVKRIAVVGGDGKDYYEYALKSNADSYLTGNMNYNTMVDAYEGTINVIEAGHFHTENPVCEFIEELINEYDRDIYTEIFSFNPIKEL